MLSRIIMCTRVKVMSMISVTHLPTITIMTARVTTVMITNTRMITAMIMTTSIHMLITRIRITVNPAGSVPQDLRLPRNPASRPNPANRCVADYSP